MGIIEHFETTDDVLKEIYSCQRKIDRLLDLACQPAGAEMFLVETIEELKKRINILMSSLPVEDNLPV